MSSNRLRVLLVSMLAVFAVSAIASASSASASCFKVVTAGTGTFEKSACEGAAGTKEYIKVIKLETRIKAQTPTTLGEWCAEVAAGTGIYKDNLCSSAVAPKNFIKVFVHEYEVCQKGGTEKFKDHLCTPGTKEAGGEWSWLPIAVGTNFPVESTGGAFTLTSSGKAVTCTGVTNTGEIGPGGESDETNITFTGCTANAGACWADSPGHDDGTGEKDGVIEVKDIDNQLVEREPNGGGANKLADEFTEGDNPNEFVTLEFDTIAGDGEGCTGFPTTKVKGQVAGECINITAGESEGEVEINFPEPELEGNTLKSFGPSSTLGGKTEVFLANGWSSRCL